MSVIGSNIIAGASGTVETGYQIERSLRFNSADTAYLNRTPASAGNRKTLTISIWFKRSSIGVLSKMISAGSASSAFTSLEIPTDNTFKFLYFDGSSVTWYIQTTQVFRDPSAFAHLLIALDTPQATASNRLKMYINGAQVTALSSSYPSQNADSHFNAATAHQIGNGVYNSTEPFSGYLADIRLIDGQALDPTSFGETDSATGVWVPKAYTGTYGTNGFWLKLDDNSGTTSTTLGKDSSGNSNNWTPNNFSVTAGVGNDSLVDSPTNYGTDTGAGGEVRGNYCTLNPLSGLTTGTLSNGNLDLVGSTSTDSMRHSTIGIPSGKWYAEVNVTVASSSATMGFAVYGQSAVGTVNGTPSRGYFHTGQKYSNGTLATYGNSFTNGDVIGIAVDVGAGKIWFSKNGVWQASGDPAAGTNAAYTDLSTTETWFLTVQTGSLGTAPSCSWNFGQRPFAYPAPSGFKALCTTNLPTPAIGASASTLASKNMNVVTYTGNGSTQSITGVGFQPDLVWVKRRDAGTSDHVLQDVVRGFLTSTKLSSSATTAENGTGGNATDPQWGYVSAVASDGFTANVGSGTGDQVNRSTYTYAAWNWKAGGTAVTNTAGSISSQVSANTTAGISVVTYTGNGSAGATVGHGLGAVPKLTFTKNRGVSADWVAHSMITGSYQYGFLNTTAAFTADATTAPTSSVVSRGSASTVNASGNTYVMYCFAEVAGFSKFGSYTGNGSADGPFVYCGFRPRYFLLKRVDAGSSANWEVYDTARDSYNQAVERLAPSLSDAASTTFALGDILSNGVKIRQTDQTWNASGGTYIFAAFAEAPFNFSRAR